MENAINVSVTPLQALLALAFQVWIVVFPIIIIKKLNFLTALLQEKSGMQSESSSWLKYFYVCRISSSQKFCFDPL